MKTNRSYLMEEAITPEFVLEAIKDRYRHTQELDCEVEPDIDFTFETTMDEWRDVYWIFDLEPTRINLMETWGFQISSQEWESIIFPLEKKTLGDLCQFIASRAKRQVPIKSHLLGSCCQSGGTFLAIRQLLAQAGANVSNLRPSSPIEPYLNRYPDVFLDKISCLAPHRLPTVERTYATLGKLFLWISIFLICVWAIREGSLFYLFACFFAWYFISYFSQRLEFPDIMTFKDLVASIKI